MDFWEVAQGGNIWIYGCIQTMVGSSWGGRAADPPPSCIFMRGSAPQTPHRFNGYTPPHLDSNVPMDMCMDISNIHGYVRVLAQGGGFMDIMRVLAQEGGSRLSSGS